LGVNSFNFCMISFSIAFSWQVSLEKERNISMVRLNGM